VAQCEHDKLASKENLRKVFDRYDRDKSGCMDRAELMELIKHLKDDICSDHSDEGHEQYIVNEIMN